LNAISIKSFVIINVVEVETKTKSFYYVINEEKTSLFVPSFSNFLNSLCCVGYNGVVLNVLKEDSTRVRKMLTEPLI
jgi:hypothetical protein